MTSVSPPTPPNPLACGEGTALEPQERFPPDLDVIIALEIIVRRRIAERVRPSSSPLSQVGPAVIVPSGARLITATSQGHSCIV